MDTCQKLVLERLKELGAFLVRHKKHHIYRLASGQNVVLPNTPSDRLAWQNALSYLERKFPRPETEQEPKPEPKAKPKKERKPKMTTEPEVEVKFEPRICDDMTDCFPDWRGEEHPCQEQKPCIDCGQRWWMTREQLQWWQKTIEESTPAAPCVMPARCPLCRAKRKQGKYVVATPAPRVSNNGNNGNGHSDGNGTKPMSDEVLLTLAYLLTTRPDPRLQEKLAAGLRARFAGKDLTQALTQILVSTL